MRVVAPRNRAAIWLQHVSVIATWFRLLENESGRYCTCVTRPTHDARAAAWRRTADRWQSLWVTRKQQCLNVDTCATHCKKGGGERLAANQFGDFPPRRTAHSQDTGSSTAMGGRDQMPAGSTALGAVKVTWAVLIDDLEPNLWGLQGSVSNCKVLYPAPGQTWTLQKPRIGTY
jgi:hypothetical protein